LVAEHEQVLAEASVGGDARHRAFHLRVE
jgi:hypothetical protein